MKATIWHNPRCSKSRAALAYLEEKNIDLEVRLYLEDGPTVSEIEDVLNLLGIEPRALMRTGEADYKDQGLKDITDPASLIEAMASTAKLIERPVIIVLDQNGGRQATIARPLENLSELI